MCSRSLPTLASPSSYGRKSIHHFLQNLFLRGKNIIPKLKKQGTHFYFKRPDPPFAILNTLTPNLFLSLFIHSQVVTQSYHYLERLRLFTLSPIGSHKLVSTYLPNTQTCTHAAHIHVIIYLQTLTQVNIKEPTQIYSQAMYIHKVPTHTHTHMHIYSRTSWALYSRSLSLSKFHSYSTFSLSLSHFLSPLHSVPSAPLKKRNPSSENLTVVSCSDIN